MTVTVLEQNLIFAPSSSGLVVSKHIRTVSSHRAGPVQSRHEWGQAMAQLSLLQHCSSFGTHTFAPFEFVHTFGPPGKQSARARPGRSERAGHHDPADQAHRAAAADGSGERPGDAVEERVRAGGLRPAHDVVVRLAQTTRPSIHTMVRHQPSPFRERLYA